MKENPKDITLAKLDVVVMPNGEIICLDKTIGFVKGENGLGKYLSDIKKGV